MQTARAEAGLASEVRAFLRAHPGFLAENPDLYRSLLPPARVHGAAVEDHMAAMIAAGRDHARAMQDQADQILAAGRANVGLAARVQEAVLALIEAACPIDCIATEFPRTLAVDAASLCAVSPRPGARPLPQGSVDALFGTRCVVFDAPAHWLGALHGEAAGLAQFQALIRVPGQEALIALAAREGSVLDPGQGAAQWAFLGRAVAAALAR
jgi:uncharacterized protein YigA (DUF484 family)